MSIGLIISVIFITFHSVNSETNNTASKYSDKFVTEQREVLVDDYQFQKRFGNKKVPVKVDFDYIPTPDEELKFFKDDEEQHIKKDYGSRHYAISEDQKKLSLIFEKGDVRQSGKWTITINGKNSSKVIMTDKPVIEYNRETKRISDNETLTIECPIVGKSANSNPIKWSYSNDKTAFYEISGGNIQLSPIDGVANGKLVIANISESQAGLYKCSNVDDQNIFLVKVKNKFSLYWPLIGIAIELLILIITIGFYEKHQASKKKKQLREEMDMKNVDSSNVNSASNVNPVRI